MNERKHPRHLLHHLRHMGHRMERSHTPTLSPWQSGAQGQVQDKLSKDVILDCGWGRLLFAHTFTSNEKLASCLKQETPGERDIALYLRDPHVVLSLAPQDLFLDPSNTYRLWMFNYKPVRQRLEGLRIRRLRTRGDAEAVNRIYERRHMVPVDPAFVWQHHMSKKLTYLVAEDSVDGRILGTVTGVDHKEAFDDPENGASLWCLAVDPHAQQPGIGQALAMQLAGHYHARSRAFMDLSVMHDNEEAIALYEKLGFQRVPVFCLKKKNPINESLFMGPRPEKSLNSYAMILVNEARRRGIAVELLDAEQGYFSLSFGGRTIVCRESLTELTNAIAMSRCANKRVTLRLLKKAGLRVPEQQLATGRQENNRFLKEQKSVVVKPVNGEQGKGVTVDITDVEELQDAINAAYAYDESVLLEQFAKGDDLRVIVINYKMVAAALRCPAEITGTGQHSIRQLIDKQSRRRAAATQGESHIPLDSDTTRCVKASGYTMDAILPAGKPLQVRRTANLHTGGTMEDVTDQLSATLRDAAERAASVLDIPVVGMDFIVPDVAGNEYVIIEANERPGLANHEPQPTAERFMDLLFPQTA
ncbi:MAG TPA: N-acetylglutaminylglutamine synthetase [Gammaproteobacteria bacterium]|nr:N-acetylglutaminylglutamine synthetase [Gammaproteobacteria bacterium]